MTISSIHRERLLRLLKVSINKQVCKIRKRDDDENVSTTADSSDDDYDDDKSNDRIGNYS